jgi:8-amino-7-oxononanoate synthase
MSMDNTSAFFKDALEDLKAQNLFREFKILDSANASRVLLDGQELINFSSNNYCGMVEDPDIQSALIQGVKHWGTGAGASRLISGTSRIHDTLEQKLADFSGKESALVFPSGYMANLGLLSTLLDKEDLLILDKTDHASIIDGARLSGAKLRVFPHLNMSYLENILKNAPKNIRKCIVTDSIFSMDGDCANLQELVRLKEEYGAWLVVDEAHAVGIFGHHGSGLAEQEGLADQIDFKIGTLSKAIGLQGGYIAANNEKIAYLRNFCRPFIYTTGLLPAICEAALVVLEKFKDMAQSRKNLLDNSQILREGIQAAGFDTLNSMCHIIPILVGDNAKLLDLSEHLRKNGFLVPTIRYPTVKKGTERLRLSLTINHTRSMLDDFLQALRKTS